MYSKVSLLFAKVTRYTREFCVYSRSNHFAFIAKFLRYIDHDTFNFFYENKLNQLLKPVWLLQKNIAYTFLLQIQPQKKFSVVRKTSLFTYPQSKNLFVNNIGQSNSLMYDILCGTSAAFDDQLYLKNNIGIQLQLYYQKSTTRLTLDGEETKMNAIIWGILTIHNIFKNPVLCMPSNYRTKS